MIDFNITTTQLAAIWIFAGLCCMIPMFVKLSWQKFLIIPIVLFSIWISFETNWEFIGAPVYDKPAKFIYKHHSISTMNNEKWITLWAMVEKKDRLYRFVYDKQTQKKLNEAKKQASRGRATIGEFKKKEPENRLDRTDQTELITYDFPHQEAFPKDSK